MNDRRMSEQSVVGIVGIVAALLLLLGWAAAGYGCQRHTLRVEVNGPAPEVERLMRMWVERRSP